MGGGVSIKMMFYYKEIPLLGGGDITCNAKSVGTLKAGYLVDQL